MAKPNIGDIITINAEYVEDPTWGAQYNLISLYPALSLNHDTKSKYKFLSALFTPLQVENMYNVYEDPFEILDKKDAEKLTKISGCGVKTAVHWINKFHDNKNLILIFTELEEYNLTNKMVERLMNRYYQNPQLVIEKIKTNPYILCTEVDGIGWNKADKIALQGGLKFDDPKRISAYIMWYLDIRGREGCSWITTDELLGAILQTLGEEVSDEKITEALRSINNRLWTNEEKTKIGLIRYFNIENRVAKELIRLRDAESSIKFTNNWRDIVKGIEAKQGWEYNEEQLRGIESVLNNNITLVQGMAGTGKTSIISAIISILSSYSYVQCALSGRAASRMSEMTQKEGFTIHRLLGYSSDGFLYNEDNKLPYSIYILDEISMVDGVLFYNLIKAIPNGSKLVCLGDSGQLESIGSCNIAYDMIHSPEINTITLTKIHRQAQKSAIITQSIAVRSGIQIIEKNWTGEEIRGDLRDLKLTCYSDASNTYYRIMESFIKEMEREDFDIMETQIIFPRKAGTVASTFELNNAIQEFYNPLKKGEKEKIITSPNGTYALRIGDKVINTINTYSVTPVIYNGNIGMIKDFYEQDGEEYMLIDFTGIGEVILSREYWRNIELGYAITCHKFQGSQADLVIFGIDFTAYSLLTRELLYTGITRAKKRCHMICQTGALRYATAQEGVSRKQTHLQQCLYDIAHPVLVF
jgi:exodeoxyribonuclease V alpha subunit